MIDALARLAHRLGAPPRPTTAALAEAFHLPVLPGWLGEQDGLYHQVRLRDALMQRGELALGAFFMANTVLWEDGDTDAPAGVVYSFDPVLQRFPERLAAIGTALYRFHEYAGEPPVDPWRRLVLDQLHSGYERPLHERVPPELASGRVAYHTSLMVFREHLPTGRITGRWVPLLVLREGPCPAMIVPSRLWSEPFLEAWR